jgi:hypothetical protein
MFPPEVDLVEYGSVGLINFSSNFEGNLGEFVTQKFLESISASQKGARIIELGDADEVLESVQRDRIDPETVQAIGQKYNVDAIIVGNLEVSDVKPRVSLSAIIKHASVSAEVEALMTAKLLETIHGATIWTGLAQDKKDVAHVSVFSGGPVLFDAKDPEQAYGDLTESLIEEVTKDLRVSYRRM